MAAKKFIVELDADERARVNALISKGKASAKQRASQIWLHKRFCRASWPFTTRGLQSRRVLQGTLIIPGTDALYAALAEHAHRTLMAGTEVF